MIDSMRMSAFGMTCVTCVSAVCVFTQAAGAQSWVTFVDETASRLVSDPSVGVSDGDEKDYAWADFDHDGDIDLVCVRKEPFTTAGRRRSVLFMDEGIAQGWPINGVLVDRTLQLGSAADDGGQGLLDLTDNRDVVVTDVNQDGWMDIVTAPTYGQGLPKTISHPRIYINRGSVGGVWQGFRYEQARTPDFGAAPNFCGVGAGDVTGDGFPDLYFVDYDRIITSPFDDKLLINNGAGFFSDQTNARMTTAMTTSEFGTTANIADMNNDGKLDIIKSENGPVKIMYNNGNGLFTTMQTVYSSSGYFSSVGDLNGDGKLDLIITDDGSDRYLLNTNPGTGGQSTFNNLVVPNSNGIGSSSRMGDLDRDGFPDVIICDVDVDIPGCGRRMMMFRNMGNGPSVSLADVGTGGIPTNMLTGTYDAAVFDINGDGWLDLVIGRCSGTQIWINQPPVAPCPSDVNGSHVVDIDDLVMVITTWGATHGPSDINHDNIVNIDDLVMVITHWGPCT